MNILITGGATGLGEAIVRQLAQKSEDRIYFTYARSANAARQLAASLPNVTALHCDFTDRASVDVLTDKLAGLELDVLVNNAFTGFEKNYAHKLGADVYLKGFTHNILPVIAITSEFIKLARKRKFGKIINIISSAIVNRPPAGWAEYTAGKAYLLSLSNSWAVENAGFNITSNAVSPAFMTTTLTADTDERIVEEMAQKHPLKTLLKPGEVAESIAYLTHCSQQVNGTNLIINAAADIA